MADDVRARIDAKVAELRASFEAEGWEFRITEESPSHVAYETRPSSGGTWRKVVVSVDADGDVRVSESKRAHRDWLLWGALISIGLSAPMWFTYVSTCSGDLDAGQAYGCAFLVGPAAGLSVSIAAVLSVSWIVRWAARRIAERFEVRLAPGWTTLVVVAAAVTGMLLLNAYQSGGSTTSRDRAPQPGASSAQPGLSVVQSGDGLRDVAAGGDDTLTGGGRGDTLYGETAFSDVATGGDDTLNGGPGNDDLYGETRSGDVATGGDDILNGDSGSDYLYGDTKSGDVTTGGDDILNGGTGIGSNFLYGDTRSGSVATAGDDTLTGSDGKDRMWGDSDTGTVTRAGRDTFVFDVNTNFGPDEIKDPGAGVAAVDAADTGMIDGGRDIGVDTIQFDGVAGGTIADLDAITVISDDGIDVIITVFADSTKTSVRGSVKLEGVGTGSIASVAAIDATQGLEVVVNP